MAKQKPLSANASASALRAAITGRSAVTAGGTTRAPDSSHDWKPISADGPIANSTSPLGLRQLITTWSG